MDEMDVQNSLMYLTLHEIRRLLTQIERIPLHVGGEPGSEWINRLLTGHPNLCKEL